MWVNEIAERCGHPKLALRSMDTGWKQRSQSMVIELVTKASQQPAIIAKVGMTDKLKIVRRREQRNIEGLGASARLAGAFVPDGTLVPISASFEALCLTVAPGHPAAHLLESGSVDPGVVMAVVSRWLESWNQLTRTDQPLHPDYLQDEVLGPLERLASRLERGDSYYGHMARLCDGVAGTTAPHVATHNDLTMANVLICADGGLSVVDWEAAKPATLPLLDYYYAFVDAFVASDRNQDRLQAFLSSVVRPTERSIVFHSRVRRLSQALNLSADVVRLAFHACWIGHAANELRHHQVGEDEPFGDILNAIACDPILIENRLGV